MLWWIIAMIIIAYIDVGMIVTLIINGVMRIETSMRDYGDITYIFAVVTMWPVVVAGLVFMAAMKALIWLVKRTERGKK
jgi:hypothetical protein